jgi:hypothetical protein
MAKSIVVKPTKTIKAELNLSLEGWVESTTA